MGFKIIVVGAGPAGSTCAAELAKQGVNIKLIEKHTNFEHVTCGGAVGIPRLQQYDIELPKLKSIQKILGVHFFAPNGKKATLDSKETGYGYGGYIFDRKDFDKTLAEEAEQKGAELVLGERVKDVIKKNDYYLVITNKTEYRANIIVDASGASAKIAKKFGIVSNLTPRDYRIAIQAIIENNEFLPDDGFIHLYFADEYAPQSYAWIFHAPMDGANNNEYIKVGMGVTKGTNPNTCLNNFIRHVGITGNKEIERRAKIVPVAKPPKSLVSKDGKVLALGDSGRLCDALAGAGIIPAIVSGRCAARAIAGGTPFNYNKYLKPLRHDLNRRLLYRKFLPLNDDSYNILVDILDGFNYRTTNVNHEMARALLKFLYRNTLNFIYNKNK